MKAKYGKVLVGKISEILPPFGDILIGECLRYVHLCEDGYAEEVKDAKSFEDYAGLYVSMPEGSYHEEEAFRMALRFATTLEDCFRLTSTILKPPQYHRLYLVLVKALELVSSVTDCRTVWNMWNSRGLFLSDFIIGAFARRAAELLVLEKEKSGKKRR